MIVDFAKNRRENDEKLLPRIEAIRSGQAFDALEPFARAYLGLYFEIDASLTPEQRVAQLANPELQQAVLEGFANAIQHTSSIPSIETIALAQQQGKAFGEGFIVLAAMDRLSPQQWDDIPEHSLQAAIAFHYTVTVFHDNHWIKAFVRQQPTIAGSALLNFWRPQIQQGARKLQGLRDGLYDPDYTAALSSIIIRLLKEWPHCKSWTLRSLLLFALQHADLDILLQLTRERFSEMDKVSVRHYVYWLVVYLILAPHEAGQHFVADIGRTKDKILPLFDFVLRILRSPARERLPFTADVYAYLLRVIAPRFHPSYDDFGQMEEKSKNVIWLFEQFRTCNKDEALTAIDRLQKVRVMRIYSDVMQLLINEIKE